MRSGCNHFNYFSENHLSKLANLVQFKRVLMSCLDDWTGRVPKTLLFTPLHFCCNIFYYSKRCRMVWLSATGTSKTSGRPSRRTLTFSVSCSSSSTNCAPAAVRCSYRTSELELKLEQKQLAAKRVLQSLRSRRWMTVDRSFSLTYSHPRRRCSILQWRCRRSPLSRSWTSTIWVRCASRRLPDSDQTRGPTPARRRLCPLPKAVNGAQI